MLRIATIGMVAATLAAPATGALLARDIRRAPAGKMNGREGARLPGAASALPSTDSLLRSAAVKAPFAWSRHAPSQRFDPVNRPVPTVPAVERPRLSVTGLLWGDEPGAIVDGLPGVDGGRLVYKGQKIEGLTILRIERSRVVVKGQDTTWVLRMKDAW